MEDGAVNVARCLADEFTRWHFNRAASRESSGCRKFGGYRRGNRGLSDLDRHADVSETFLFLASLTPDAVGGDYA